MSRPLVCSSLLAVMPLAAAAQPAGSATVEAAAAQSVTVTGKAEREASPNLDARHGGGSRLGLSVRETPASVEVISQETLQQRGATTLEEALRGAVGVTAGGAPGSPGVASTRGFHSGFLTYLFDGSRVGVPSMTSRPQDSFHYERIEVLKGPASVLHGEGGIGGAVNFVTKRPDRRRIGSEALLGVGSRNSLRVAAGRGGLLGATGAWRLDLSHQRGDGWVQRSRSELSHLTSGVAFDLSPAWKLEMSLDLLHDDMQGYWGTPLVPRAVAAEPTAAVSTADDRVVDRRLARTNYNVADGLVTADSAWWRGRLTWHPAPAWTLRTELSAYQGDRHWRNAESASFVAPDRIQRDQVEITHDHRVLGQRTELSHQGQLAGFSHRWLVGLEHQVTDFATQRRFSNGSATTQAALQVQMIDPDVGVYDPSPSLATGPGNRTDFGTDIGLTALFFENALKLGERFTLVLGGRHDRIQLERRVHDLHTDAHTAFDKRYRTHSLRAGAVFELDDNTAIYGQVGNGVAPVGTSNLLLLSAANAQFPLTKGRQAEVGLKQTVPAARLDWTLALYRIEQDNILSRDPANPAVTVNNGRIGSQGVELSFGWRALPSLTVSGNAALLKAEFKTLVEAGNVSRVGNTPPNVAERTANLWLDYKPASARWSTGLGLRHVGPVYTNNANSVRIEPYTLLDLHATWQLRPAQLRLALKNATDRLHATWAGANASHQVMLGAPRTVEATAQFQF